MRDPARIRPFLEKLGDLWEQFPDYRFGQLIMNLSRDPKTGRILDPWEWEQDRWEVAIDAYPEVAIADQDRYEKVVESMAYAAGVTPEEFHRLLAEQEEKAKEA